MMTHAEWLKHIKKHWRKKPDDTLLSHAARLIRLEILAYEGTGNNGANTLYDIADRLERMDG